MELAMGALLEAQRVFKLEFDKQWTTLQKAINPLQQKLLDLHVRENHDKRNADVHLTAGAPMSEDPEEAKVVSGEHANTGYSSEHADRSLKRLMSIRTSVSSAEETEQQISALERAETEERARDEANEMKKEHRCWRRWLRSSQFDVLVGVFILANMLLLMIGIQHDGSRNEPGLDRPHSSVIDDILHMFEHIFTAFFLLELILRLAADGVHFLHSIANFLDGLIVLGSCLDTWVLPALKGSSNVVDLSLLRIFRLLRLAKVLRVVRVMKFFGPLRVLIQAVFSSLGSLLWSMALLFLLEIIGAILFAQLLASVINDETRDLQLREKIWKSFGTMVRSWLTLFEITMAPGSFLQHRYLFEEVNPLFVLLIICYVCFVTFAVIRIITALFLKATLSASDQEARQELTFTKKRRLEYAQRLCSCLEEDLCQARIDRDGLARLLTFKRFTNWLDDAGLTVNDTTRLFKALDNGDGFVALDDFLAVISQICDSVTDRDAILHQESASLVNAMMQLCTSLHATENARGSPMHGSEQVALVAT
jgi:hypothetical protein